MPRQAVASSGRRRAINTKITDELRAQLEATAAENDRTLSGEIEQRLERSLSDEQLIADLRGQIAALKERDALLWRNEADRIAGLMFATTLQLCEARQGKPWREDSDAPKIIGNAIQVALGTFVRHGDDEDFLERLLNMRSYESEVFEISTLVRSNYMSKMPKLGPIEPSKPTQIWQGKVRSVVTLTDKSTGKIVDVWRSPPRDPAELGQGEYTYPGLSEFRDRYVDRKDSLQVSHSMEPAFDEPAADTPAEPQKRTRKAKPKSAE